MSRRYRLTAQAQADLTQIVDYVAARSPQYALKVLDQFEAAMKKLAVNPGIGHRREDVTNRDVLFYSVFSYLIVYRRDRRPVEILHVVHGARNLKAILGES